MCQVNGPSYSVQCDQCGKSMRNTDDICPHCKHNFSAPPAPQGSGEHKLVAENVELRKELAEVIEKNREFAICCTKLGGLVDEACDAGEKSESDLADARTRLAEVESARDQALTLGEAQVLEIQELRQVVKQYLHHPDRHHGHCHGGYGYHACELCIKADALLEPKAKPTQQGDKE